MRDRFAILAAIVLLSAAAESGVGAQPASGKGRAPNPSVDAQQKAMALVRDVYKDELAAARTPQQKKTLFEKLLNVGIATQNDPAGRLALWQLARDGASQNGDIDVALRAIAEMARQYQVEELPMKVAAFGAASKSTAPPAQQVVITNAIFGTLEAVVLVDNYGAAQQLASMAETASKQSRDSALIKRASQKAKEIAELAEAYDQASDAKQKLISKPDDAAANLEMGRFYCFLKQDWKRGLPHLTLGHDKALQTLAARELNGVDSSNAKLKLADDWWAIAEQDRDSARERVRLHASAWYRAALPNLTGLDRARVEKRLKEVPADISAIQSFSPESSTRSSNVVENSIGLKLAHIPAGEFDMGSPIIEARRNGDEQLHHVKLSKGFYLGVFEVTQAEYVQVMGTNPSYFCKACKGSDAVRKLETSRMPVENVSWDDAVAFCKKLSDLAPEKSAGRIYRLPTEAEWEYSCRAGTKTAYSPGDGEDALANVGWYNLNSEKRTHIVGEKRPNDFGVFDMHGNVWEMCADWLGDYSGNANDPLGASSGPVRIARGGCWSHLSENARAARRGGYPPEYRNNDCGFRVACFAPTTAPSSSAQENQLPIPSKASGQ